MAYLTIEEINTNPLYAPLGYEPQFENRIEKEVFKLLAKLDITKKITPKNLGIYYDIIKKLLNPYTLEKEPDNCGGMYYEPDYRTGTNLQFFASWNDYPVNWKTRGCHYHRINLKTEILTEFDYYFRNL